MAYFFFMPNDCQKKTSHFIYIIYLYFYFQFIFCLRKKHCFFSDQISIELINGNAYKRCPYFTKMRPISHVPLRRDVGRVSFSVDFRGNATLNWAKMYDICVVQMGFEFSAKMFKWKWAINLRLPTAIVSTSRMSSSTPFTVGICVICAVCDFSLEIGSLFQTDPLLHVITNLMSSILSTASIENTCDMLSAWQYYLLHRLTYWKCHGKSCNSDYEFVHLIKWHSDIALFLAETLIKSGQKQDAENKKK